MSTFKETYFNYFSTTLIVNQRAWWKKLSRNYKVIIVRRIVKKIKILCIIFFIQGTYLYLMMNLLTNKQKITMKTSNIAVKMAIILNAILPIISTSFCKQAFSENF